MSWDCIVIKDKKFIHQPVFDGAGDGCHCVFCQKAWNTRSEAQQAVENQHFILADVFCGAAAAQPGDKAAEGS